MERDALSHLGTVADSGSEELLVYLLSYGLLSTIERNRHTEYQSLLRTRQSGGFSNNIAPSSDSWETVQSSSTAWQ